MTHTDREYQIAATDFLVERQRAILHVDPGLGKTLIALRALQRLGARRVLVIAGENPTYVWADEEIPKWAPEFQPFILPIRGQAQKRIKTYQDLPRKEDFVAFATMQSLHNDYGLIEGFRPDAIIYDEAHKAKNRKTVSHKVLKEISKHTDIFIPMSGHIVSRGPADLWALLHCVDPKTFSSFWQFAHEYCTIVDGPFGQVIGGPRNIPLLRDLLKRYVYYKTKKDPDIACQLPPKTRQTLPTRMTPVQYQLYKALAMDMLAEYGQAFQISKTQLGIFTKLRQMLICPKILFPDADMGGAWLDCMDRMEETPHMAIYSPFVDAFPYWEADLKKRKRPVSIFKGGMTRDEIGEAKARFAGEGGVALLSVSYAESLSLESASYGYFIGFDLDQNVNFQAEDRLHRMTSKNPVFHYYYDYLDSNLSAHMFHLLGIKTRRAQMTNEAMQMIDLVGTE